jgi:hypothetical protein
LIRAIGYAPVSLDERLRSGVGIAAQRSALEAACRDRGWDLVEVVEVFNRAGNRLGRDSVEQQIVAEAIEHHETGLTVSAIAGRFNARDVAGHFGDRWRRISVRQMQRASETVGRPAWSAPERVLPLVTQLPYGYRLRSGESVEDECEQARIRRMSTLSSRPELA